MKKFVLKEKIFAQKIKEEYIIGSYDGPKLKISPPLMGIIEKLRTPQSPETLMSKESIDSLKLSEILLQLEDKGIIEKTEKEDIVREITCLEVKPNYTILKSIFLVLILGLGVLFYLLYLLKIGNIRIGIDWLPTFFTFIQVLAFISFTTLLHEFFHLFYFRVL